MKKLLLLLCFLFTSSLFALNQESFWNIYTAALRGDTQAQYDTGVIFERGIGTEVNQSMAAKWYEKAAIAGHKDAQFNLGIMYASGMGVEQNIQFAMMWLASAAAQGDDEARKFLNQIIDSKKPSSVSSSEDASLIKPIRFKTNKEAKICSKPAASSKCISADKYQRHYTSNKNENGYYKITGIATGKGWRAYEKEGWIKENSIEIQR